MTNPDPTSDASATPTAGETDSSDAPGRPRPAWRTALLVAGVAVLNLPAVVLVLAILPIS